MRAERFGSYSMVATFAGMSSLSRLKSMTRYIRLWPPPRHHDVSWPWLLRPPVVCIGSTSGLYGSSVVMSSKVCTVWNREPGDVGLYLRIGIDVSYAPSRNSGILAPSANFTYAFFQSDRRPAYRPCRFTLPCAMLVRMLSTLALS